jgi:16S rRNA (uracil1498-N3)-methyltransferase
MMNLFYDPNLPGAPPLPCYFILKPDESWHAAKVLRLRPGDGLRITDGKGLLYHARLIKLDTKACEIEIYDVKMYEPPAYSIHLAVAPVKNMARFEWFLEKATEVGINEITPLICARSEKISVRTERLYKIITSAMKQSLGTFHPKLNEPAGFRDVIEQNNASAKFIGWCETRKEPLLREVCPPGRNVLVLIGPEGDFTADEVQAAKNAGFVPISLGKNRLRTETAALAACFIVHFVNGGI